MKLSKEQLRAKISELTEELNGQYPRPWMTDLDDPRLADVFIVGMNPATAYSTSALSHDDHVAALFNDKRGGCRRIYDEMRRYNEQRKGQPSPTREGGLDVLVDKLSGAGVERVLETNVICCSTPMSKDVRPSEAERGKKIFRFLLCAIEPKVLIFHGSGTRKKLESLRKRYPEILGHELPPLPTSSDDAPSVRHFSERLIVAVRSLAPPGYYHKKWPSWAPSHLAQVAKTVADYLRG